MTELNMQPFDPTHTGEFCTRRGNPVELLKRNRKSCRDFYPLLGLETREGIEYVMSWSEHGKLDAARDIECETPYDLMCVLPKREARVRYMDAWNTAYKKPAEGRWEMREVLPDDISQERAQAVFAAVRDVLSHQLSWADLLAKVPHDAEGYVEHEQSAFTRDMRLLRAALGDDA